MRNFTRTALTLACGGAEQTSGAAGDVFGYTRFSSEVKQEISSVGRIQGKMHDLITADLGERWAGWERRRIGAGGRPTGNGTKTNIEKHDKESDETAVP